MLVEAMGVEQLKTIDCRQKYIRDDERVKE